MTVLSDAQQGSEFAVLGDSARRPAPAGNPTAGNPPPPATVEIGGIAVTLEELNEAIDTLVVSNPIMVKAPLEGRQPAGRPQVSRSGRHGTRVRPGGDLQTKTAFVSALRTIAEQFPAE